jgi:hypothetical protein
MTDIMNSGRPWAVQKLQLLQQYQSAYRNGQITSDDYRSLLNDLSNMENIQGDATDMQIKAELINAIQLAASIIG